MNRNTIGNDRIPSVKLALGEERKVTGVNTSTVAGGETKRKIKYQVPGTEQGREMLAYLTYVCVNDRFIPMGDI